jgi:hypothetical protein
MKTCCQKYDEKNCHDSWQFFEIKFLVILIEILILKTTMYHKYNFTNKKLTLTFETNDEHQAKSYQNALRYNVITKLR